MPILPVRLGTLNRFHPVGPDVPIAPLGFVIDLGAGTSFTDRGVRPGKTYRFAATAYNDENTEGAYSTEVAVAVSDTTPPVIPAALIGTPGDELAVLD